MLLKERTFTEKTKMMSYKAVIFDLDGTLVNSLEDLADSMNEVLTNHGLPVHTYYEFRNFIGRGLRNLVIKALPEQNRDEELINSCLASMIDIYRGNCINKTKVYDGIPELLTELSKKGIKMAVFSNKADEFTKQIVKLLLPNLHFEAIVGLTDENLRKPNPANALAISKILNIAPSEIVYCGDSIIDMQTATNAGMYAAGVLWGFDTEDELLKTGAKLIIKKPCDLIEIF